MSLIKKYGNPSNKSKRNSDEPHLETSTNVPSPLFRKSASIDPPITSDTECPPSQQSGRGGSKKKILPTFFSNLFSNNSSKIPEESDGKKISSSRSAGGEITRGKKSSSRESLNSVLSSSSFSYVNPKKYGGKRVKGKRIPVDDPNYGSTTHNSKNSEGKRGFGNTIEKIGVKMGLKKKYNLQSCESLQYIDACEESLPTTSTSNSNSATSPIAPTVAGSSSAAEAASPMVNITKSSQGQTPAVKSKIYPETDMGRIDPALKFAVIKSSKIAVKSHAIKDEQNKSEASAELKPEQNASTDKSKTSPLKVESTVQTISADVLVQPPQSSSRTQITSITPSLVPVTDKNIKDQNILIKNDVPSVSSTELKEEVKASSKKSTLATSAVLVEKKMDSTPEALPSTTKSASPCTSSAIPSTSKAAVASVTQVGNSNTWNNSARRKRKAPKPPSTSFSPISKYSNGVSSNDETSVVADLPNDVPSSSSRAAALTNFKRIEESPPPHPVKEYSGTFEIRPRKKERSVEPMPVSRPTSSFATPSSNKSNTLFSTHNPTQHKRSNSEGQQVINNNTKGRVHKPGKKKAPPPPNPFGDPDVPEDEVENRENNISSLSTAANSSSPTSAESATPKNDSETTRSGTSHVTSSPIQSTSTVLTHTEGTSTYLQKQAPTLSTPSTSTPKPIAQTRTVLNPFDEGYSLTNSTTASTITTTLTPTSPSTTTNAPSTSILGQNTPSISASTSTTISMPSATTSSPSVSTTTSVAISTSLNPVEEEYNPEIDEEIRQNMLNDQQERQQLGLANNSQDTPIPESERLRNAAGPQDEFAHAPSPSRNDDSTVAITQSDIEAAQHSLDVLSTAVKNQPQKPKTSPAADPSVKAKLAELKKEAETSPLNAPKSKSRPMSIGSAIYESLLGKSTSSSCSAGTAGTSENSVGNSPKVAPKPWYKNLGPYKSRHPPQIRPFTSLVKFSELDKEATRIVEENKRKSGTEDRFLENAQDELDELFAGISDDELPPRSQQNESQAKTSSSKQIASSSSSFSPNVKVFTTAQVHPTSAGAVDNQGTNSSPNTLAASSGSTQTTNTSQSKQDISSKAVPSTSANSNDGSSSPPTFQSVHAASKHRQIKPLLSSSPISNLRSEKLAIVQPQASSQKAETKKLRESSTLTSISSTNVATSTTSSVPSIVSSVQINQTSTNQINMTASGTGITSSPSTTVSPNPTPQPKSSKDNASSVSLNSVTTANTSHWDCPRCTLKNPNWRSLCEACYYRKEPIGLSSSSSFMSSIFQKVNAESNKMSSNTSNNSVSSTQITNTTPSSHTSQTTRTTTTSSEMPGSVVPPPLSNASISSSSVIENVNTTAGTNSTRPNPTSNTVDSIPSKPQPSTSKILSSPLSQSQTSSEEHTANISKKPDIPSPPPCENFLSQLPAKEDILKEEKLQGINKFHGDPELEELDIRKLRRARLAYFQRSRDNGSLETTMDSVSSHEVGNIQIAKSNDLGSTTSPQRSCESDKAETSAEQTIRYECNTFADNEDDFIDGMLQLDSSNGRQQYEDNIPTTIANITQSKDNSNFAVEPPVVQDEDAELVNNTQIPQIQNRYKPRLEAIREGSSQDYMYCYSPSEIAQIYENWQASQSSRSEHNTSNKNLPVGLSSPSFTPSGLISSFGSQNAPLSHPTHLFGSHQAGAPVMFQHLHDPLHFNGSLQRGSPNLNPVAIRTAQNTSPMIPSVLMMTVDHQPYANNRLTDSPEENYVNTAVFEHPTICTPALNTPTLNDTAHFSRNISPIPPTQLSPFPTLGYRTNVQPSVTTKDHVNTSDIVLKNQFGPIIPHFFGENVSNRSNCNNYENNMSFTPGEPSQKLSYEDYQKMGAIPKGFPFNSRQNDEWSSESSADTDSSRCFRGRNEGYQDSQPGMSRKSGCFDFPQEMFFPDQTVAVGKLMKRLEAAIANGDHRLAATLAHDLALMKVNCVVAKINKPFSIRVYVEDRFMQQGPFLVQVSSMMTVRELKAKIESDWGIPSGFQKWILGQKMADDDNQSLSTFEIKHESMAFLFLVTPDMNPRSETVPSEKRKMTNNENTNMRVSETQVSNNISSNSSVATASCTKASGESSRATSSTVGSSTVIDPVTMHAYECVDDYRVYNNLSNTKSYQGQGPSKTAKTKTSTAVQTTTKTLLNQGSFNSQENEDANKERSPPPIPSKSPVPQGPSKSSQFKPQNTAPSQTSSKQVPASNSITKSSPKVRRQEANTKSLQKQPTNAEPLSAASAITLSLQQKLAEFKVVAEQTFGKAGLPVPSSSSSSQKLVKESSPAPSLSKSTNLKSNSESSSLKRSNETKDGRKLGKSQITPSSSKEKLMANVSKSTEKLAPNTTQPKRTEHERPITPENRFNGILLPSAEDTENLKPPERPDKLKRNLSPENSTPQATAHPSVVSSEETTSSTKNESENQISPETKILNCKKPPVPPPKIERDAASPLHHNNTSTENAKPQDSILNESNQRPSEGNLSAPQPTPRGLKRQVTSPEKTDKVADCSTTVVNAQLPTEKPVPTPRAVRSPTPKQQIISQPSGELTEQNNVTMNEYCQTTLPFPKPRIAGDDMISSGDRSTDNEAISSSVRPTEGSNKGLLRPSAFVTQMKSDNVQQTNIGTANKASSSSNPTSYSPVAGNVLSNWPNSNPQQVTSSTTHTVINGASNNSTSIAIAHVQPLSVSGKQTTPPTAYVTPSPSSSSASTPSKKEEPSKKQDDSAQSYLKMLELMEKQDLICTTEDAECPVCFASMPKGEGIILRDCLHVFCRECLVGCVQYADDSTVKCPYRDNDYACNNNLQEREIKALVPSEVFEKYLARSVKLAESKIVNTFHCKTFDCTGWCVFEDDVNVFLCPVCKKRNCLTCQAIHEGIDCQRYQRELAIAAETDEDAKQSRLMLEKMIQRGEALECPACHVVLLKKWGCDWVRCSYCKTEICWVTKGFRWGKGGKGDLSGGCRCGVNGVKCHPKCTYCH